MKAAAQLVLPALLVLALLFFLFVFVGQLSGYAVLSQTALSAGIPTGPGAGKVLQVPVFHLSGYLSLLAMMVVLILLVVCFLKKKNGKRR